MSDIPTTHKIPDALLGKLLHLSRAPTLYAPACEEAAAEITRLRAENERTKALLARVTDDVARYNDEARKARADLAAAQERERALLETIERVQAAGEEMRQRLAKHMAALSAVRGKP